MKQIFEEDEKEVEEEYEDKENPTEVEEQVHKVSPKTPSKRVQYKVQGTSLFTHFHTILLMSYQIVISSGQDNCQLQTPVL